MRRHPWAPPPWPRIDAENPHLHEFSAIRRFWFNGPKTAADFVKEGWAPCLPAVSHGIVRNRNNYLRSLYRGA